MIGLYKFWFKQNWYEKSRFWQDLLHDLLHDLAYHQNGTARLLLQQVCNLEQFVPKILHFLKEWAMSIWIFSGSIFEQENSGSILFKFRLHRYVNHCSVFFAHGKKKPTGYWDHGPIVVFSQSINRSSIDLTIKIWKKCNFWCVSIPCICQGPEEWKKLNNVDLITFEEILSRALFLQFYGTLCFRPRTCGFNLHSDFF